MTARYDDIDDDLLDDDEPGGAEAWIAFAKFLNEGELLDNLALAARDNPRARKVYLALEEAAGGEILSLRARLLVVNRP